MATGAAGAAAPFIMAGAATTALGRFGIFRPADRPALKADMTGTRGAAIILVRPRPRALPISTAEAFRARQESKAAADAVRFMTPLRKINSGDRKGLYDFERDGS